MSGTTGPARIAVIAGDGIGLEVVPAAIRCIDAVREVHGVELEWRELDWGSDYYRANGRMMPADGLDLLARHDAIFLGAVGDPSIPDTETLWGLLIPIRRRFEQYVNLRPARSLPGIPSVLRRDDPIDLMIVRENSEGEYSEIGGRYGRGLPSEAAMQETVFTRTGIARVARFAADLASTRSGRVTSATKSNGIIHTMPFWDEVVEQTLEGYPAVQLRSILVDALAAALVLRPWTFDVLVASNLLGDILSDLASAVTGSIGVAPSANLNPERKHPSMFEPVHGSAPDIAGKGIANPIGQIWSGAMMLEHLGHPRAAAHLVTAFEASLASGVMTGDLGGTATTEEFVVSVLTNIDALAAEHTTVE
ncbi:tartrate dehydrogenase [Herbiconiux daphne]|uniref:Tartrate dehydrogenase n=1 Tax=Herbiconiux daphne TaxID=2970914 RepID=A0ABT2GX29_9MICO|nr:tartrate dehydrogenase [Herbiconiux daphne]MCS5732518.1 tartrate dehydrogenase [Herbiconiux daphne]